MKTWFLFIAALLLCSAQTGCDSKTEAIETTKTETTKKVETTESSKPKKKEAKKVETTESGKPEKTEEKKTEVVSVTNKAIFDQLVAMNETSAENFGTFNGKLDGLQGKIDGLDKRLGVVETGLSNTQTSLGNLQTTMVQAHRELAGIEEGENFSLAQGMRRREERVLKEFQQQLAQCQPASTPTPAQRAETPKVEDTPPPVEATPPVVCPLTPDGMLVALEEHDRRKEAREQEAAEDAELTQRREADRKAELRAELREDVRQVLKEENLTEVPETLDGVVSEFSAADARFAEQQRQLLALIKELKDRYAKEGRRVTVVEEIPPSVAKYEHYTPTWVTSGWHCRWYSPPRSEVVWLRVAPRRLYRWYYESCR